MAHSEACKSFNRFGDFDCVGLPRCEGENTFETILHRSYQGDGIQDVHRDVSETIDEHDDGFAEFIVIVKKVKR